MAGFARSLADAVSARSPAQWICRRRTANDLVVLAYHDVEDASSFDWHAGYLVRTMRPVSADDITAALEGRRMLPPHAVLITFDDGDPSIIERGLPILRQHGLPAIAFVIAGLIDTDSPPWWIEVEELMHRGGRSEGLPSDPAAAVRALKRVPDDERLRVLGELQSTTPDPLVIKPQLRGEELREAESAGMAIGNHSMTHPLLDRCSDARVESELVASHAKLTELLGHPPTTLAYPNGNVDARAVRVARDLGYRAAFLFDHRVSPAPPPDPLRISRIRVDSSTSPNRFRMLTSGLHPLLHHAAGRD